ncbi:MAG: phage tail tape measure protein [Clostridia bacterium]|nr:phage tail tape measure protein [Clostridia bacterium]
MANRIKGITVEIGGDTTGLDKALKGVNGNIKNTQTELRDVERLLKFDPKNTELLKQKQDLLKKSVGETADKLKVLKEAEKQVQEQVKKGETSQEQYRALKREIAETEKQMKSLKVASSATISTMNEISDVAGTVANKTRALSAAAGGLLTAGVGLAINAGKSADDINTISKQSGFSTSDIQKFQYAAERIDVDLSTITGAATKMKKSMVSSSKDTQNAWRQLGVSVTDENGKMRDINTVFYETIEALSRVENETERDQLAMQIFGKSADQLAGIVDDGGAALKEMGEEAEKAGLILGQDALDSANDFNDSIDKLKATASKRFAEIGSTVAKDLLPYLEKLCTVIESVLNWFVNLSPEAKKIIVIIIAIVASISPIASIISGISTAIGVMNAVTAASPVTWIVLGIVAAVAALIAIIVLVVKHFDEVKAVASKCWEGIKIGAEWAWYGVKVAVFTVINLIIKYINLMIKNALTPINLLISALNLIPGVNIKKLKFEISEIKLPDPPKMALGGVLKYSSAIVGEAGAEVLTQTPKGTQVTPLSGATAKRALGGTLGEVVSEIRSLKKQMSKMQTTIKVGKREFGRVVRENV